MSFVRVLNKTLWWDIYEKTISGNLNFWVLAVIIERFD
jgi:hypothetical protein